MKQRHSNMRIVYVIEKAYDGVFDNLDKDMF